jgi:antitoxin HicB
MKYTVILSPDPDQGGYSLSCPALPGALSDGSTRAEALENIREAIALWLEVAQERGESPPIETPQVLVEGLATKLAHREELGWDRLAEVHPCELTTRHE